MKPALLTIIPAALLFAAWFTLVLLNKADANQFLGAVQAALVGLGVHQINKSKKEP